MQQLITQEEVELGELLHVVSSRDIVDEVIIWKTEGMSWFKTRFRD